MLMEMARGKVPTTVQDPMALLASVVVHAMVQLQLYQVMLRAGGGKPSGHWLYMSYRGRNGQDSMGRCTGLQLRRPGLAPPEVIADAVVQSCRRDMDPRTNVGAGIRDMGGLDLWEGFR